ncbi:MAG TPA: hypothetical protein VGJ01_08720 [Pseudolabrys sp.]|jgi:hypothetical protein
MTIRRVIIIAASALTLIGAAHAGELKPVLSQKIDLGEVSGVAYYTVERDGFHVVATLAEGITGMPVRVRAILAPGQSVVLSTPRKVGAAAVAVEISRHGNQVLVGEAQTN